MDKAQSEHLAHLTPRPGPRQSVVRHSLLIEPAPSSNVPRTDYFGNTAAILTIVEEHSEIKRSPCVDCEQIVRTPAPRSRL